MAVIWALLAATANAMAAVLQRRAARAAPQQDALSVRLVADLVRRPVWFGGIATLILGFLLQALALHAGAITVVEPLLIAELPLTLIFAAVVFRAPLRRRDWLAAVAMAGGLALLLAAAAPGGGRSGHVSDWAWALTIIAVAGLAAALVAAGWRVAGDHRAALWGIAAGAGFGLAAALIKATTAVLSASGPVAMLTSWKPYAMVAAGVGALYLFQNAVQAGRLVAAQPAISLTDPVVSVLIGMVLFGEHVRTGIFVIPELAGAALIAAGTIALARSPVVTAESGDSTAGSAENDEGRTAADGAADAAQHEAGDPTRAG